MTLQERLATGRGKWTPEYPYLGTAPVDYEDCISPEYFADEREAVFRRWWLYVGREDRVRRPGTYFTRELPGLASIVVARGLDGTIHAFHNVCAHRGNKVVWQEHPAEETSGTCRAFHCKYHGWQYGMDGRVEHITNEDQFFDLDRSTLRLPPVHCDVMGGFVFVNLAEDPPPLREFLGERLCEMEAYPFHLMTQRYGFSTRVHGNWKLAADTILEWYHPAYVHQKFIHPDVREAEKMVPPIDSYHYELFDPHILNSVPGPPPLRPREPGKSGEPRRDMVWIYRLFRGGLFGPDDVPDIGPLPEFLNKGGIASWGNDQFWLLPNLSVQIWARNFYITYTYLPESVGSHIYDIDLYFVPPATTRERLAQELVVNSVIEIAMQDVNTVEASYSALTTRAQRQFQLSDQELMIRSFHHSIRRAVEGYRNERDRVVVR
jgi:phenylpropionate dioxygenase-like ring-hydroxylating dioxygenase large terminal subunit